MKKFDVVFIGAGPGGYSAAILLAKAGKKVAIVEKNELGGTCVNEGCIPTKTLLKSAKTFDLVNNAGQYGIEISGNIGYNFSKIQQIRQNNKTKLNFAIETNLTKAGVTIFRGQGIAISPTEVQIGQLVLTTKKLVLATGSRPRDINFEGKELAFSEGKILNSTDWITQEQLPKSLIIIGGGPIALEMAFFAATLGIKVSLLEYAPNLLRNFDQEAGEQVSKLLVAKGIDVIVDAKIIKYEQQKLWFKTQNQTNSLEADKILLATGRIANIEDFAALNLEYNVDNSVKVNQKMETSIDNVYAIGDLTGSLMLTTTAYKQGDILIQNLLGLEIEPFEPQNYGWAIHISPELAGAGMTKAQAVYKYGVENVLEVKLHDYELPRSHADSKIDFGFFKILINKKNGLILGALILLDNASLLINEIALALVHKITIWDLAKVGHTHPTLAEAIYYVARNLSLTVLQKK